MRHNFIGLLAWFLGLMAFSKGVKLLSISYPADKIKKFARFAGWLVVFAGLLGLICVGIQSVQSMTDKDHMGGCYHCKQMEMKGCCGEKKEGEMSCPAEEKK